MWDSFFDPFFESQSKDLLKLFYEVNRQMNSWEQKKEKYSGFDKNSTLIDIITAIQKKDSESVKKAIQICGDMKIFAAAVLYAVQSIYENFKVYGSDIIDVAIDECAKEIAEEFSSNFKTVSSLSGLKNKNHENRNGTKEEKAVQKKVLVSDIIDGLIASCVLPEVNQALRLVEKTNFIENIERFLEKITPGKEVVEFDDVAKAILYAAQDIISRERT